MHVNLSGYWDVLGPFRLTHEVYFVRSSILIDGASTEQELPLLHSSSELSSAPHCC